MTLDIVIDPFGKVEDEDSDSYPGQNVHIEGLHSLSEMVRHDGDEQHSKICTLSGDRDNRHVSARRSQCTSALRTGVRKDRAGQKRRTVSIFIEDVHLRPRPFHFR